MSATSSILDLGCLGATVLFGITAVLALAEKDFIISGVMVLMAAAALFLSRQL